MEKILINKLVLLYHIIAHHLSHNFFLSFLGYCAVSIVSSPSLYTVASRALSSQCLEGPTHQDTNVFQKNYLILEYSFRKCFPS